MTSHTKKLFLAFSTNKCMDCGVVGHLHLHHINLNPLDDRFANTTLVCRKCHRELHKINGKSRVAPLHVSPIKGPTMAVSRFNIKYAHLGGYNELRSMALDKNFTLQAMGDHFGVTRERIRQMLCTYGIRKSKRETPEYEIVNRPSLVDRKLKNLYIWLISAGIPIGDFCKQAGIQNGRMSLLLNGGCTPTYDDLIKIKTVTGMDFEKIMAPPDPP